MLSLDVAMLNVTLVPDGVLPEKVSVPQPVLSVVACMGLDTHVAVMLNKIVGALTRGTCLSSDVVMVIMTCQYLSPVSVSEADPFRLTKVCVLGLPMPALADV